MKSSRQHLIAKLKGMLGVRKLIWVGTRAHDAQALLDFPHLTEVYGITAPLGSMSLHVDFALEQESKSRVDLDVYSIDLDRSDCANAFRRLLLMSLTEPTVVVAYRPLALLSALCYPRSDYVTYMGMFHERQLTFEHKPWVESELRRHGIPVIPWKYYANEDQQKLASQVAVSGPLVVRPNRSNGGAGLSVLSNPSDVTTKMLQTEDGFLAAAPLLEPHIPINVNACVFRDGTVSLHPPSLQLIGITGCTRRRFGYCGNDFSATRQLDPRHLIEFERLTRETGQWLLGQGYLGAFGVDALIHRGKVILTEINPRFQGSSLLSARLDRGLGRADVFLCHIAAHLGQAPPEQTSLVELALHNPPYAQVIVHNLEDYPVRVRIRPRQKKLGNLELLPAGNILIQPNATILRVAIPSEVTRDGRSVQDETLQQILASMELLSEAESLSAVAEEAKC